MIPKYKTKSATAKSIYKLVYPHTVDFFRDKYWRPVRQIFKMLGDAGCFVNLNNAEYKGTEYKVWNFSLEVNGFKFNGYIKATFCGFPDDPTDCYDLIFVIN